MKIIENVKLMEFDTPNRNGRIYSKEVVEKGIEHLMEEEHILGELGQSYESSTNLSNVSHEFTNLHTDDKFLYGDLKVLDTPSGKIIQDVLKSTPLYITSRGVGEIDEDGRIKNINIISFDIVSEGGFENCKING